MSSGWRLLLLHGCGHYVIPHRRRMCTARRITPKPWRARSCAACLPDRSPTCAHAEFSGGRDEGAMFAQVVDRECEVGDDSDGSQRTRTPMNVGDGILMDTDEAMAHDPAFDVL